MQMLSTYDALAHDPRDPNPWLALYLDRSIQLDDEAKLALLKCIDRKSVV